MAAKQIDLLAAGIVDSSNNVLQSGTVELYESGTTTPVTGYADSSLSSSLGSTVTLDSRGAKLIFVDGTVDIKLVLKDSEGSTINTYDGLDYSASEASIIESNPEFLLHNTDQEDTDGGRQSIIRHKGEQSGGTVSTLATLTASHDGTGNDEKGKYVIAVNDGNDSNLPTDIFEVNSDGIEVTGNSTVSGDSTVTGNVIVTGTVDGVDVATHKTDFDTHISGQSNAHTAIDSHIADGTIHFTAGATSHTALTDIGTNTHPQIDTHIADSTLHFTEGSITHANIVLGTGDHTEHPLLDGTRDITGDQDFTSTGAIKLPSGTTAQRPTGVNGKMRYNSTLGIIESYENGSWATTGSTGALEAVQQTSSATYLGQTALPGSLTKALGFQE